MKTNTTAQKKNILSLCILFMNVLYTTNTENTNFHQASGKLEAGIPFLY
jgi:hypothetical protein